MLAAGSDLFNKVSICSKSLSSSCSSEALVRLSVLIITDPGSFCQRSIIHTVALGENVVAITSSLPCAAQGPSHAVSSSASILPTIPTQRRNVFVIPFINIEIP